MLWGKQSRVRATGSREVKLCKRLASFGLPGQKPVSSGLKEVKEFAEQISRKSVPGRGNSRCKGPAAGAHLRCLEAAKGSG